MTTKPKGLLGWAYMIAMPILVVVLAIALWTCAHRPDDTERHDRASDAATVGFTRRQEAYLTGREHHTIPPDPAMDGELRAVEALRDQRLRDAGVR